MSKVIVVVETQDKVIRYGRCGRKAAEEFLRKRKESALFGKIAGTMAQYYPNDRIDAVELSGLVEGEVRFW